MGCEHVPNRYNDLFFDTFDANVGPAVAAALEAVRRLVAGDIRSVLLSGPVGVGKSDLAARASNELASPLEVAFGDAWGTYDEASSDSNVYLLPLQRAVKVAENRLKRECPRWLSVPRLLGALRREMRQDNRPQAAELATLTGHGLLVLDDLGSERATEWAIETLFEPVSLWYEMGSPIIATSNLTASELVAAGYERLVSRIADDGVLVALASASDYRMTRRRSVA